MSFERYTSQSGLKARGRKGQNWKPRFYCDDTSFAALPAADKPYTAKLPVVHLEVTPRIGVVDDDFTWDISESNSASSTIDTFCVYFTGDASESDIIDGDWSADPLTDTVSWPAVGDYVVSSTVTDILGEVSQTGSIMVSVINLPSDKYVATLANGVYLMTAGTPAAINTGLTGDNLKVLDLKIAPWTRYYPQENHTVWITTVAGVAYTNDGGQNWTPIAASEMGTPANDVIDDPAPATGDLYQVGIEFSKTSEAVYITRAQDTPDRLWVYKYEDGVWTNDQVAI